MLYRLILVLTLYIPVSAADFTQLDVITTPTGPGRMSVTANITASSQMVNLSCMQVTASSWWCYCLTFVVYNKAIQNATHTSFPEGEVQVTCLIRNPNLGSYWNELAYYSKATITNVRTDIPNATVCARFTGPSQGMQQWHLGCQPLKDSTPPPTTTTCTTENTVLLDHGVLTSDQLAGHRVSGILELNCSAPSIINFSMHRDMELTGIPGVVKLLLEGENLRTGVIKAAAQGMNYFTLESTLPASSGVAAGEYSGSEVISINYF
ncbi:hypothetical protein DFO62_103361 [Serratia fonticola]|nr:hypothetical protein DFO62_103361 [Serratia fonticola]